jgi:predicted metal-dependent peptidase
MIKLEDSDENFYFCSTANWSTVVLAKDKNEAAIEAMECAKFLLDNEWTVSPCMRIKKVEDKLEDADCLFRIDEIFADMGMHKESRSMSEIIKNLKK